MNTCSFCGAKITPNQEKTSIALFTKPVCSKTECEKKAQAEANMETEKLMTPRAKVLALLARRGFEEQSVPGFFLLDSGSTKVAVDLNKVSMTFPGVPQIGVLQVTGDILEEGHGISRIDDLRREIEGILKSGGAGNGKKETPAPNVEEKPPLNITPENALIKGHSQLPKPAPRPDTELTVETIVKYVAPLATEQEAYQFLQLCKARNLNPFLKEAYLIKYSEKDAAAFVVGKDAFTKRADMQPDYKGFQAGIIIKNLGNEQIERREGSLLLEKEILVGGWAKVFRKDREPYLEEVSLSEYIKKNNQGQPVRSWATMPASMIRKVALVHALREAYPCELGGLYDQSEFQEMS